MAQRETNIQARILVRLTQEYHPRGIFWRNNTGVGKSMDGKRTIRFGCPGSGDILGCLDGRFVSVEVKTPAPGSSQEESQRRFQRAFEAAGGLYIVARSPDEAISKIEAGIT